MVISGKFLGHIMSYFHHISPQFFPVHPPIPTFFTSADLVRQSLLDRIRALQRSDKANKRCADCTEARPQMGWK